MLTVNYSFHSLGFIPDEIEELMGFEPGQAPEPFPGLIIQGLDLALLHCRGTGGYVVFKEVYLDPVHTTIQINSKVFHPGKTVIRELKDASQAVLFLCTAGREITNLAKQHSACGDELMAYVLDVIGSVAADKVAGKLLQSLEQEMALQGLGITDSFSPGYCNWSVSEQQTLFSLLPSGFCGITLSPASLMDPVKSVSGIAGIGAGLKQKGYQCNWCTDRQCIYGKIRRSKKAKKNL
jgi:hypothetical protein